jgi:hypothetical protein
MQESTHAWPINGGDGEREIERKSSFPKLLLEKAEVLLQYSNIMWSDGEVYTVHAIIL